MPLVFLQKGVIDLDSDGFDLDRQIWICNFCRLARSLTASVKERFRNYSLFAPLEDGDHLSMSSVSSLGDDNVSFEGDNSED